MVALLISPTVQAGEPEAICYKKKQKCCYEWYGCGKVPKTVTVKYACPYQKCHPVCEVKKVLVGKACHLVKDGYYGHKKHCEDKFEFKKHCQKKCDTIDAVCVKYQYYEYLKYCPKLKCHPWEIFEGTDAAPAEFTDLDDGTIVKTEDGPKTDVPK